METFLEEGSSFQKSKLDREQQNPTELAGNETASHNPLPGLNPCQPESWRHFGEWESRLHRATG
jgi:hypothetical protein